MKNNLRDNVSVMNLKYTTLYK